jgi:hypothetical protein
VLEREVKLKGAAGDITYVQHCDALKVAAVAGRNDTYTTQWAEIFFVSPRHRAGGAPALSMKATATCMGNV